MECPDAAVWQAAALARPELVGLVRPRMTKYSPHRPTPRQTAFLLLPHLEALYGGSAGGGKSDALLMAALQYVDVRGYAALLLRRTYADLSLPGALMDRAETWLAPSDAKWEDRTKTWHFPSGATLCFGYLETERDKYRYQGAELQFIGFDELTRFTETQYRYLLSRVRRLKGVKIPLRVRTASNPGGVGHEWVKLRWGLGGDSRTEGRRDGESSAGVISDQSSVISAGNRGRIFIPAKLDDNPYLDREEYRTALAELDPITRRQLLDGDWTARAELGFFRREWFRVVRTEAVPAGLTWVRFWDCAAKVKARSDYWAGAKVARDGDGRLWIADVVRGRWEYADGRRVVLQAALADGKSVKLGIEDTGTGSAVVSDLKRDPAMAFHRIEPVPVTVDKAARAGPWASRAAGGLVSLVEGAWVGGFLDECDGFPSEGAHDDQVDAVSGAYAMVAGEAARSGAVASV